jgi:hypothetical protein
MALNGKRLGDLLLEADVLNKRQLQRALALQESGDKRQLGEILIELGFITLEDLTEIMLSNGTKPPPQTLSVKPKELSEEAVLNTKFTLSVQTMVAAATGIASLVGMWYMLQADIQEAKELPNLSSLYENEYPSRPEGHNWPRSYEQYKTQVGSLQEDMDDVYETLEEYEDSIKELRRLVSDLRVQVANKRDK